MTRRSRASSTRSNAPSSDSGGDSIQISASNSQKHNDEVSDFKGSENVNESSGPGLAQLTTQQAENSRSPQVACNPPGERVEQIESHPAVNGIKPLQVQQRGGAVQSSSNDKDMSHGIEDKVHRVKIESDRTGWGRISDLIRQYDRDRVEDVKEDIDTLLVFAGLFSAVITTFIVESYKTLQEQSEDTTNQILLQLSAQLASLTLSNNFINSTLPPYTTSAFVPIRFSVLINTLWLLSLILALVTASLGILVKQWLHELMARDTQDPRRQVKLRFFREIGVQRWQVLEIAAALPLLLQLALLLFFIGLSAFFHNLNPIVTWVVTGVMILWLIFYLFMTFAPAFSSQCPYKTPILKGFLHRVRVGSHFWISSLGHVLYSHIPATWPTIKQRCKGIHDSLNTWSAAWMAHEETEVCKSDIWDLPTLICSQELLRGEQLDETIAHCFQYCDVRSLLRCFEHLSQGVSPDAQGVLPNIPQGFIDPAFQLFRSLMGTLVTPSDSIVALSRWYITSTYALLKSYDPAAKPNILIPPTSLQILIRLINENATSAIFSILTMYSIRYHIMENYPRSVDSLFLKSQDGIGKFSQVPSKQALIRAHRGAISSESDYCNQGYLP
ncbi:hypothetical protein QCA50_002586 [Cerrena zonata]|uniref:DUF6535 domain-containing protein n=1 Tax=Cerrena zonata TaxID=2478898 RepID=A0AAW0GI53_9APHY